MSRTSNEKASSSGILHDVSVLTRASRCITHVEQQDRDHKWQTLAVSHLGIIQRVSLEDIKQILLTDSLSIGEECMVWKGTTEVSSDGFLVWTRFLQQLQVGCFKFWILRSCP